MTEMTIQLPLELAEMLRPYTNRIPELLERGMRVVVAEEGESTAEDEAAIMALLAGNRPPEEVLGLRPSAGLQMRASQLLAESKAGTLSRRGEAELERIMTLERLVRLAKANAHQQIAKDA